MLDDYRMATALNVPLALTLDTLPAFRSADFVVISEELAAIRRYLESQKKG